MSVLLPLCMIISMFTYSHAAYCVCKDGNEQVLQKAIDYACGNGADCSQIQTSGACFQPNTVKNHCDVAVNSYYQKKASTGATCDFNGAAIMSPSASSSCLSGSSSSGTPTTGTPTSGTPTSGTPTSGTPTSGTPTSGTPTGGTPTSGTPTSGFPNTGTPSTGTSTGMPNSGNNGMPTSSSSSVFPGTTLGPTGSGGLGDPNAGEKLSVRANTVFFLLIGVAIMRVMNA
ncbi:PREDICTED: PLASMODESMATA CALLOSE-BINDING PROTEIN 4-like [Camelina sativa]|uniref:PLASMODESMATA CALLOSE-BINDING PROTEIN 4-like n=1 Tax=Camelina sativa TaxID=90675 RepID=A0ABM0SSN0_CAMSA|nr:PREDICTED: PLASMODESMATA CALLOSE-BINDING PROTEIN 4-like [Camelina sativa]